MRISLSKHAGFTQIRAGLCVALGIVALSQMVAAENLAGVLTSRDDQPIAGAFVTALGTSTVPWTNARSATGKDGAFTFSGLLPGDYRLCAQVLAGGYLNPCQWSLVPTTVTIAAGKSVAGFRFALEPGSILKVRVNDPLKLIGTGQTLDILMGAYAAHGLFESVLLRGTDSGGRDLDVTIPFDMAVNFSIRGNSLRLSLDGITDLDEGVALSILHKTGQDTPPPLVLKVTGTKH